MPGQRVDIAMIGAGPQALTLALHLLQKRKTWQPRLLAIDPGGTWLGAWQQRFTAHTIAYLRSPAVHHPDPDPYALRRFVATNGYPFVPPYDRPMQAAFQAFVRECVERWCLAERVLADQVVGLTWQAPHWHLALASGSTVQARRLVWAKGSMQPVLPAWYEPGHERCLHSTAVDLRRVAVAGQTVVVVGGGLTAGQLALGAIAKGARVILLARRPLVERQFDTDPGWLGPKYLKGFEALSDWQARWQAVQTARGGGSVTPEVWTQLQRQVRLGQLDIRAPIAIEQAHWQSTHWQIELATGESLTAAWLWLATGTHTGLSHEPLLQPLVADVAGAVVADLPILDDKSLQWPGKPLYVMGRLASLHLGPTAGNLAGARRAAQRIVPALLNPPPSL